MDQKHNKNRFKAYRCTHNRLCKKDHKKYGNKPGKPEQYIFPIFSEGINEMEKLRTNQNLTRFINQHIKKLAKDAGLTSEKFEKL